MKILISPISLVEAQIVVAGGCDILDIKNVKEGSLGAQPPWVIQEIVQAFKHQGLICSATLGDLPQKPGTAGLAAYGAALCGVDYVKAGLHDSKCYQDALDMMNTIVKAVRLVSDRILVVASGYADFRRFGGVSYQDVVAAARDSNSNVVMLDTAIKDGMTLLDNMNFDEIQEFVDTAHEAGLLVALAGSIKEADIEALAHIGPDIVGVRGAVCDSGNRKQGITLERVTAFMNYAREIAPDDQESPPALAAAME